MKSKLILAGIAAALLTAPLAARAADIVHPSYKAPAYVGPAAANWTGFYVGINGGYGFGSSSWTDPASSVTTGNFDVTGGLAGGTLGYNFQTGTWVWGFEGDFDASWMKGSDSTVCTPDCETKNDWLGTARLRVGYAGWNNWLPYLTGGAAFGDIKATQGDASESKMQIGWTAGVGLEYAFRSNCSAKIEYLYADLGKMTCAAATCGSDLDVKFNTNIVRLGVNYRF